MKNIKIIIAIVTVFVFNIFKSYSQSAIEKQRVSELPVIYMEKGINVHFISPEPIQFVDMSTNNLMGDLPADNIARLKISDSENEENISENKIVYTQGFEIGIITIVGKSFMAQYRAIYQSNCKNCVVSNIQIQPENMQPLEYSKLKFSDVELKKIASDIQKYKIKKKPIRKKKSLKLTMKLNNIYVIEDYIFLDISVENDSNLVCDIETIKFSIEDKKIHKATNNQSIFISPLFSLNKEQKKFRKSYRNIFVFEKFTFPNSKVLLIRLIEEQISGRVVEMKINYSDVLEADTI